MHVGILGISFSVEQKTIGQGTFDDFKDDNLILQSVFLFLIIIVRFIITILCSLQNFMFYF